MKKRASFMKKLLLVCCLSFIAYYSNSQQALWTGQQIVSPEIKGDTVFFRLFAPNAQEVKLTGEWMPFQNRMPGAENMQKDANGVWSYSTNALKSDLYGYSFIMDGVRINDPNNVFQIRDVATVFNIFIIKNGKGDYYSVNSVPHGTVSKRWYNSPTLKMTRRITIYTPPGYEDSKGNYPVLYLLHGMGGDEEAWISLGRAAQILDNLIAQGKAMPMIVVMPNGNVSQEAAPGESSSGLIKPSMMLPKSMEGSFESSFMDIVRFVESNYRVIPQKSGRAIAGLSMGGFHSLHISRFYPNTFDYVGLFSAAIFPPKDSKSPVYENIDETLKAQIKNGVKLYWIGIGKDDFLYKNVTDYRAKLDQLGMKYTYYESEGGHTWTNWRTYLTEFAQLLFK
jgi:enterochelin esterase family protein